MRVLSLACLAMVTVVLVVPGPRKEASADAPDFEIKVEAAHKELSDDFFWFHPYLAAIPGAGEEGLPAVILATQKHLVADDHYSPTYVMRTDDLGKTWSGPTAVPQLKWMTEDGYDLAVSSIVPNWHSRTRKLLAIGHCNLHDRPSGFIDKPGSTWLFYTTYNPETGQWSDWAAVGERGKEIHGVASGCSQWLVEPDGSILLPVYLQTSFGGVWDVQVWKCAFDGEKLAVTAKGNMIKRAGGRGIHEPSLTKFQDRYWLTIRSDDTAFVTTSEDGLHYEPITEWTFDDGKVLGSINTQQHWVTHSDGLFLVYTRRGADNEEIARYRAPLFIARVDPEKKLVLRETERVLLPNRGVPLGNFGANHVTPNETWVSVGENMWNYGKYAPTAKGAEGAILIGRIIWSKPNRIGE